MIGSIVTGVLLQMISGEAQYVEGQSARQEVQQNSRVALELIGSELRSLAGGGSLVRADDDSLTIRTPRIWGSVCAVPGPTTVDVAFPDVPGMSFSVNSGTGLVVNLGQATTPVWSSAVTVSSIGAGANTCGGAALPTGVQRRSLVLTGTPSSGGSTPLPGNLVYVYDQVTYRTGMSSGVPGRWIQRRIGDGANAANQPMAGPVNDGGGLEFRYFTNSSSLPLSTPIVDTAVRDSVSRIALTVHAVSRNGRGDDRASKTDTILVPLRNRRF